MQQALNFLNGNLALSDTDHDYNYTQFDADFDSITEDGITDYNPDYQSDGQG